MISLRTGEDHGMVSFEFGEETPLDAIDRLQELVQKM